MTVGERIKKRRIELGISAEELASKIGKVHTTIIRYENGAIEKLPCSALVPIAEALMTTPAYLMGWDESPEPHPAPSPDTERDELINRLLTLFAQLTAEEQQFVLTMIETMIQKH